MPTIRNVGEKDQEGKMKEKKSELILHGQWDKEKRWKTSIYSMWQEIFADPEQFAEYYYKEMYSKNRVYTMWSEDDTKDMVFSQSVEANPQKETLCGMIHLNPYEMKVQSETMEIDYIVGVAVDSNMRRNGIMRTMLQEVMKQMKEEGKPFTFLMPAKEAYYTPFDFRFVYERYLWKWEKNTEDIIRRKPDEQTEYEYLVLEKEEEYVELVAFCQEFWKQFQIATVHTKSYFEMRKKELKAESGDIVLIKKAGKLCGYFSYAMDEKTMVLYEFITKEEPIPLLGEIKQWRQTEALRVYFDWFHVLPKTLVLETIPTIMFRILDVEKLFSYIRATKPLDITFTLEDPMFQENSGNYHWQVNMEHSHIERIVTKKQVDCVITIAELTEIIFGYPQYKENKKQECFKEVIPLSKIYISEIV